MSQSPNDSVSSSQESSPSQIEKAKEKVKMYKNFLKEVETAATRRTWWQGELALITKLRGEIEVLENSVESKRAILETCGENLAKRAKKLGLSLNPETFDIEPNNDSYDTSNNSFDNNSFDLDSSSSSSTESQDKEIKLKSVAKLFDDIEKAIELLELMSKDQASINKKKDETKC